MKSISILAGALLALLAGCGSEQSAGPAGNTAPAVADTGDATAEQVARQARGKVKCPAAGPVRPDGTPVDDVLGVRPGMTWDDATRAVLCSNEMLVVQTDTAQRFNIQTHGHTIRQGFTAAFAAARVEKSSRQIMQEMQDDMIARSGNAVRQDMQPGQSKWYVSTMGVPGAERVIAATREEWFEQGREPTVESVEHALAKKYGAANRSTRNNGHVYLQWSYDPQHQPIANNSPLYHTCTGTSDPDGGTNFSPECGIVIVAQVYPLPGNTALSQYFQVGVIDQANGYAAITGTEKALEGLDAQRRAREVDAATRNADAPQL